MLFFFSLWTRPEWQKDGQGSDSSSLFPFYRFIFPSSCLLSFFLPLPPFFSPCTRYLSYFEFTNNWPLKPWPLQKYDRSVLIFMYLDYSAALSKRTKLSGIYEFLFIRRNMYILKWLFSLSLSLSDLSQLAGIAISECGREDTRQLERSGGFSVRTL